MRTNSVSARAELENYMTADEVVLDTLQCAWEAIAKSTAASALGELHLLVYNPDTASESTRNSYYATAACQALPGENTIVVNERFLKEVECMIRSFAQSETLLGSPFLKCDAQLFGLAKRLEPDPTPYLKLLRAPSNRPGADPAIETLRRRELGMTVLFFLAHELGHLVCGHIAGQFAAFVNPSAPLERKMDAAAIKLCRHVDEFTAAKFSLGGFAEVGSLEADVRRATEALRHKNLETYERVEAFFAAESDADKKASAIVGEYLDRRGAAEPMEADRDVFLLGRGLFAVSIVTWYHDLSRFSAKLGEPAMNSLTQLTGLMTMGREQYISASELFGEYHRTTMLRACIALESAIKSRSNWFDLPDEDRSIWCAHPPERIVVDEAVRREWWLSETLQRYHLLSRCLDTAIKIAHFGGALAWIREADCKRGTKQIFIMTFYSIASEVQWLKSRK